MSSLELKIPVVCGTCGADLGADLNRFNVLEVGACPVCIEKAKEEGHKAGYRQAENDADPTPEGTILRGAEQFEPGNGV